MIFHTSNPPQDDQETHHQYLVVRRLANIFKEQKTKNKKPETIHKEPYVLQNCLQEQRHESILGKGSRVHCP